MEKKEKTTINGSFEGSPTFWKQYAKELDVFGVNSLKSLFAWIARNVFRQNMKLEVTESEISLKFKVTDCNETTEDKNNRG